MKVLLVGNGCSATEHKLGKVIDSEFDLVLRMNRFKTKGFEEYVGSKTDVWVVTDNAFQWVLDETEGIEGSFNWKNYKSIYIGIPSFKYEHSLNDIETNIKNKNIQGNILLIPKQVGDIASEKLQIPNDKWPTLGMQCLYTLLLMKENHDIYIYGFDGKNKKYKYLHYYDEGYSDYETEKYYNRKITHEDSKEYQHIKDLVSEKKIKRLEEQYKGEVKL